MNAPTAVKSRAASPIYTLVVLALLFLAAWLPRVLQLDTFVTIDERRWLTRSANYYTAITHNDLSSTAQTDHPGVTVMWAGALGYLTEYPEYAQESPGQLQFNRFEFWINEYTEHKLLDLLVAGRWWIVLSISLLLALSFLPLREVFDAKLAAVAVVFMAWDPFQIALSRFLHLDGLLTVLLTFSLLTFIAWVLGQQKSRYLVISGITFGLAALTKMPAVFLAPGVSVLALLAIANSYKHGDARVGRILFGVLIWGVIAVCTFALLWPALWLDPIGVITKLVIGARTYVAGHELPNFFMGEITQDPGPFFYPVAYLFRTTPITLLGLAAAFIATTKKKWPVDTDSRRLAVIGLAFFAILFTAGMMTAAKKFDRYLLPVFPALDIVAALGWAAIARYSVHWWCQRRTPKENLPAPQAVRKTSLLVAGILAVVVLLQGLFAFNNFPYYLTYYNPIMGDIQKASEMLMVGWGEGLDQAAAWINEQEDGDEANVVAWYEVGPFSYYLDSDKQPLWYWLPDFWFEADYAITYINQWQRELPDRETIAFFESLEPVHTVSLKGLEMAKIYDLRDVPPPAFTSISTSSAAQCNDHLVLSAYQQERDSLLPGDSTNITLFLKTLSPIEENHQFLARLQGDSGETVWEFEQAVGIAADLLPFNQIEHVVLDIVIPLDAAEDVYRLSIVCLESEINKGIANNQTSDDVSGVSHNVTTISVLPMNVVDLEAEWAGYELKALRHQPKVAQGYPLKIILFAGGDIDGTAKVSMRLLDADGGIIAQYDQTLETEMQFPLRIPDELAPDRYDIAVIIYEPENLNPIPDIHGNELIPLSKVEVIPR